VTLTMVPASTENIDLRMSASVVKRLRTEVGKVLISGFTFSSADTSSTQ
jgi:hypothetical protein